MESRLLLSGVRAQATIVNSGGSLPTETVGSSTDMTIPGSNPNNGNTHEITVGPDGDFYVTQMDQDRIVKMTLDGKFSFIPTGSGSMPHGEEFDAAGHLWVGLEGYGSLVEMTTGGQVLGTHTIPYANTQGYSETVDNHGLYVAPDGKIWYTGKASNTIGYYDTTNNTFLSYELDNPSLTEFPDGNFPIYIDQAPDGSMYFTELDTSRVGRLIPSTGQIIQYTLPGQYGTPGNARPIRVLVNSDGTAVVSEEAGAAYAYISPQGVVTEYPLSPSGSEAASLTYDRAGVLWVQYNTPDAIGQVQPNGSVKPFTIPTLDATQHRITIGPDGDLWFTELAVNKIGRMVTGTENGPPIDSVSGQRFQSKNVGIDYQASFKQGKIAYHSKTTQHVKGHGNNADRKVALSHFRWNLQGSVNKLAGRSKATTFGVMEPTVTAHVKYSSQIKNGSVVFSQSETIGGATYFESYSMNITNAPKTPTNLSSLSSATAHYLEALKVLSDKI